MKQKLETLPRFTPFQAEPPPLDNRTEKLKLVTERQKRLTLVEQIDVLKKLERIVNRLVRDQSRRQELLQEATVHLWQLEKRVPDQTTSWYLQSCRFHVQHLMRRGSSVDAPHRGCLRIELPSESNDDWNVLLDPTDVEDEVVSKVSAREILALVSLHLTELERKLLTGLILGFTTRELAEQLRLSQTCIVNRRRRIAGFVRSLGVGASTPFPKETRNEMR